MISSRAVSEAIASLIAFTIIIAFFFGIYYMMLTSLPKVPETPKIDIAEINIYGNVKVLYRDRGTYIVRNIGSSPISIDVGVVSSGYSVRLVNISKVCSGSRIIQPGAESIITCPEDLTAFIARAGSSLNLIRIIYPEIQSYPPIVRSINMTPLLTWDIVSNIVEYLEDSDILRNSAINTSINMVLYVNTSGTINADLQSVALAIVTSSGSDKYNILITGARALGGTTNSISIGGNRYDLSKAGYYRYRIKIVNFTGTMNIGRGVYPCYINSSGTCRITFSGTADRILIYTNSSRIEQGVVGIEPFYIIGDLDGNGYPEYIFTTQDFTVGGSSNVNDRISTYRVVDSSRVPLRIVFRDQAVNNNRYSSIIVSLRFFYWDNSQDDVEENYNRIIMRVGLYDPLSKSFIYSTSLSYYELCRYRSVSPFSVSYIVKDFLIYVPSEPRNRVYYVAVEIVDPYSISGTRNDADIILGVEYIGIVLGVRT